MGSCMMKILLDADASIKLTKISIIEKFALGFNVVLTADVYDEQVTAGLKKNLPDARRMEKLVLEGKITVVDADEVSIGYSNYRLGRGEKSVINYFLADGIDLIVSDDEAFLKILDAHGVPFTPVAGVILMCVTHGIINKENGHKYLEMLTPMIREEHMFYIKSKIEDL